MLNYELIGNCIHDARIQCQLTQFDLSELVCRSPQYISQIECGKKKASLEVLVDIANALGTTVNYLLRGNQKNDSDIYVAEISNLLDNTDSFERYMILEIVKSITTSLQKYQQMNKEAR